MRSWTEDAAMLIPPAADAQSEAQENAPRLNVMLYGPSIFTGHTKCKCQCQCQCMGRVS